MRTLIDFDDAPVFAIPTARGVRQGVLVEGPQGWGEFSPPADSDDRLAARWLTAAMEPSTVGWPDAVRGRVPVAVRGARVEVSGRLDTLDADTALLTAARDTLSDNGLVRCVVSVDDVETSAAVIPRLVDAAGGLELIELRCRQAEDVAAIRRRVEVPVAVDATLWADGAEADIAVLRCGALGGVRRALRRAEKIGLPALVNFAGATSIGLAGDVALAAALPELPYACGPGEPVRGDVVTGSRTLIGDGGHLPAAPMPAAPEPGLLAQYVVTDDDTVGRWRDLLRRAAAAR